MRTGDAETEIWRDGLRHTYCCEVTSQRKRSKARPRYFWRVEQYLHTGAAVTETDWQDARGFSEALRLAFREADAMEGAEQTKRKAKRRRS